MLTIGFTTKFYTLWDVNVYPVWLTDRLGQPFQVLRTSHRYLRNLSMDLDAAKEKVRAVIGDQEFAVDLGLHGVSWFVTDAPIKDPEVTKDYTFTFGQLKGQDIRIAGNWITEYRERFDASVKADPYNYSEAQIKHQDYVDAKAWKDIIWQLERAMKQESTARRKVYARRRLIDLGALVRRDWVEKYPIHDESADMDAPIKYGEIKRKWMPKGLAKWFTEIGDKKGLFYKDGIRIPLTLKQVKSKMIDSQYGVMYVVAYLDQDGHIVTYKGGTPPRVEEGKVFTVNATIKHVRNETYIQRLKIVRLTA